MNKKLPEAPTDAEEITFAELMRLVRTELQLNPNSTCEAIAEKYEISETTMRKLIHQVASGQSRS